MGWRAVCFLMEEFRLNADGKSKNDGGYRGRGAEWW